MVPMPSLKSVASFIVGKMKINQYAGLTMMSVFGPLLSRVVSLRLQRACPNHLLGHVEE